MRTLFRRSAWITAVTLTLALLPRTGEAQTALAAADLVFRETELLVRQYADEMRQTRNLEEFADRARDRIAKSLGRFSESTRQLDQEIARLNSNPEKNAQLLERLQTIKTQSSGAHDKLKAIGSRLANPELLRAAQGAKSLERLFNEVADTVAAGAKGIRETREALGNVGDADWKPGLVKIDAIEVIEGDLAFYMADRVAGFEGKQDVRLSPGVEIPIDALPIRLRACVWDEKKKTLTAQKKQGSVGNIQFNETTGSVEGHAFSYTGEPGTTEWTAKEQYTFTPDRTADGNARIRTHVQSSADKSTAPATGDVLEIHTDGPVAQKLVFDVEGTVTAWHRKSTLNGVVREQDVVPGKNTARARITLSLFSR